MAYYIACHNWQKVPQ